MELVLDGGSGEKGPSRGHLVENASDAPHVDGGGVLGGAEEDVGRAVPQRHNLVRVRLRRHRLGAGQTEIGELQVL